MDKKEKCIIIGPSGSGKDYLMRRLVDKGLKPCLKWTTRPMRLNESQGKDYDFKSNEEFNSNLDKLITHQTFSVTPENSEPTTWHYGISKEEFLNSQVVILTPVEYKTIDFESFNREDLFVVYLDIERVIRESRLHNREDKNDSIKRRLDSDEIDFNNFSDYDLKITDPEFTADDVYNLMD